MEPTEIHGNRRFTHGSALKWLDAGTLWTYINSETLGRCSALAALGTPQLCHRVSEFTYIGPSLPASNLL